MKCGALTCVAALSLFAAVAIPAGPRRTMRHKPAQKGPPLQACRRGDVRRPGELCESPPQCQPRAKQPWRDRRGVCHSNSHDFGE